jgi:NAD(P)-dependent dehydrogenase (short-subunit alcohol dehydrogenase family)
VINILDNKIAFQQFSYAAYLLSKKSLADFTRIAAIEYAPNIRINAIAPGVILPGDQRTSDYLAWRVEGIPLKTQGEVEHLIKAMQYIINNDFITGQILVVDGGEGINHQGQNAEQFDGESDQCT